MATSFKLNQQYLFYSEYTTILETIFFIEYIMDNITITIFEECLQLYDQKQLKHSSKYLVK